MTGAKQERPSTDGTDEVIGPAAIPLDELNSRLAEMESLITDSLRSDEDQTRIPRATAIVLADLVFELANPVLKDEGNARKLKNLKDQVRFAAFRFSEYDTQRMTDKIRTLKESANDSSPAAIAALRQLYRQPDLPEVLADEATRDLAEATIWQVGLNHSPAPKNQVL